MIKVDLTKHGITVEKVLHNASPAVLYVEAMRYEAGTSIADNGALVAYSGKKTGRSPTEKRVVQNPQSQPDVWWGEINIPLDEEIFLINQERAIDYLNTRDRLYVVDAFAGSDPEYKIKVRVICARAYHALFMWNMLIRPTTEELANFGEPDYVIYNAGKFPANSHIPGMTSKTTVDLCFEDHELVILGTEYAGEMKKGIFTVMNYLMPKVGHLSMHCSATESKQDGSASILFGLSGTGKTTLSADPNRVLIGDDEHVWTDRGIFNIEGGCYAKAIHLSAAKEPDIYEAIRFGAVLENVILDPDSHAVDYDNTSITENTRASYPIEYIHNAKLSGMTGHPQNVIFLTCDAFGVLPPVSKLTPEAAMYHFISGYTAKVAGTEMGIVEPQATFSPCFGGPFLVWHPNKYAELLAEKIRQYHAHVWLVNTGWSGGAYGVGDRIDLTYTRAIIDAIHNGSLAQADYIFDPIFRVQVPTDCAHVPNELLIPRQMWADPQAYDRTAHQLAHLFHRNFAKYISGVSEAVRIAGPVETILAS